METLCSYLSAACARTLAALFPATMPGMAAMLALDDTVLAATMMLASIDVDRSMRYQGRRWDISGAQILEFPRIPYTRATWQNPQALPDAAFPLGWPNVSGEGPFVWDWDPVNQVPVVPVQVQVAALFQGCWIMQPEYAARLEKIRSALASEKIGTASEMFIKAGEAMPGGFTGLCDRSSHIMGYYRIRSGEDAVIANASILRIDRFGGRDPGGGEIYTDGTTLSCLRCFMDGVTSSQRFTLQSDILDAKSVCYVAKLALSPTGLLPPGVSDRLLVAEDGDDPAGKLYQVVSVANRQLGISTSHYEIFVKEAT